MSPFSEMGLWWIVLVVVLAVVRCRCNDSTLKSVYEDSFEMRINDTDDHNHNNTDSTLDHFGNKDVDSRRRKGKDVWVWDLYCHLQPVKGNCQKSIQRYYYDAQLDTCGPFNYSGCHGNHNNFETALECERRCKGANFMGVNEQSLPTVCYLQPDSGLCLAFITNYYYDVDARRCKPFTFGGCGGNLNRFKKLSDCEEHCSIQGPTATIKTKTTTTSTKVVVTKI